MGDDNGGEASASPPPVVDYFTCANCGGAFESDWTQEEALAEARENGFDPDSEEMVSVCDDCYDRMMAWGKEQGLLP